MPKPSLEPGRGDMFPPPEAECGGDIIGFPPGEDIEDIPPTDIGVPLGGKKGLVEPASSSWM